MAFNQNLNEPLRADIIAMSSYARKHGGKQINQNPFKRTSKVKYNNDSSYVFEFPRQRQKRSIGAKTQHGQQDHSVAAGPEFPVQDAVC